MPRNNSQKSLPPQVALWPPWSSAQVLGLKVPLFIYFMFLSFLHFPFLPKIFFFFFTIGIKRRILFCLFLVGKNSNFLNFIRLQFLKYSSIHSGSTWISTKCQPHFSGCLAVSKNKVMLVERNKKKISNLKNKYKPFSENVNFCIL